MKGGIEAIEVRRATAKRLAAEPHVLILGRDYVIYRVLRCEINPSTS
jgi:hypothetical protein